MSEFVYGVGMAVVGGAILMAVVFGAARAADRYGTAGGWLAAIGIIVLAGCLLWFLP